MSLSTLVVGVLKTSKTTFQQTEAKQVMPTVQIPYVQTTVEKPVVAVAPVINEPIVMTVENNYREQKIEPIEQLITVPVENQTLEEGIAAQLKIEPPQPAKKTVQSPTRTTAKRKSAKSTRKRKK